MRLVVVGLGGIGSILIERLGRFLNYSTEAEQHQLVLVDGDNYEVKNFERQEFSALGPKSEVKANEIKAQYIQLSVEALPMYIDMANINTVIKEGDIVFVCVDNHKTRNIISTYAKMLKDITIISGGNELSLM